jgi:DeoR/GlpR family transcriptional regulator of sugar metabolism
MNIRQAKIIELMRQTENISINEIKIRFNVSDMTARRDLQVLETEGYITRVQGGGLIKRNITDYYHSFYERERMHIDLKKKIARRAMDFIYANEKVILDTGTTTYYMAQEIAKSEKVITVATTSLAVANTLYNTNANVLVFGGFLRKDVPDLVGPLTEKYLIHFHADKLFIGCDGIMIDQGLYTSDLYLSSVEEKMIHKADKVILVTDSSKFGKKSFIKYGSISDIDIVVTDDNLDKARIDQIRELGIEIIITS